MPVKKQSPKKSPKVKKGVDGDLAKDIKILESEFTEYVEKHPEIKKIADDFVTATIAHRPSDVVGFAAFYFNKLVNDRNHKEEQLVQAIESSETDGGSSMGWPPLIFCGPSGVGKGTVLKKLKELYGTHLSTSVSHTSRSPREGEVNGVHYHFVPKEDFEQKLESDEQFFIEHACVHGNYYGTSITAVQDVQKQNKLCILEIDVQGAEIVRKAMPALVIYIAPPSLKELERRLRSRGTESEEKIKERMSNALVEMRWLETPGNSDFTVMNDDVDRCVSTLGKRLTRWFPSVFESNLS